MMTTGRVVVFIVGISLFSVGCGRPEPSETARDLLYLRSARGVAVLEPGAAAPTFRDAGAVASRDWSTIVRTYQNQGITRVVAIDPETGTDRWERGLAPNLRVKVVSEDGDLVALGPVREPSYRDGRAETKLVIATRGVEEPRSILLEGNYEPEAFSTDGTSLFVIKYMPARNPSRYQVRRLDIATGNVQGVYTPDAHLQRAMGGTARIQVGSPDGRRLYTLYTLKSGGTRYAFIHVLSLDGLWAHCIDLPVEFAASADSATAMAVAPDGRRLYVTNGATGALAEIDTGTLKVLRTTTTDVVSGDAAYAALDSDSTLYLASGRRIAAVDVPSLTERRSWVMRETVRGIQTTGDGLRLYIGLRDRIAVLDSVSGRLLESFDPPGVKRIDQFGPVMRPVDDVLRKIRCAC
jgi:outer membrane protein assembly factor BamB